MQPGLLNLPGSEASKMRASLWTPFQNGVDTSAGKLGRYDLSSLSQSQLFPGRLQSSPHTVQSLLLPISSALQTWPKSLCFGVQLVRFLWQGNPSLILSRVCPFPSHCKCPGELFNPGEREDRRGRDFVFFPSLLAKITDLGWSAAWFMFSVFLWSLTWSWNMKLRLVSLLTWQVDGPDFFIIMCVDSTYTFTQLPCACSCLQNNSQLGLNQGLVDGRSFKLELFLYWGGEWKLWVEDILTGVCKERWGSNRRRKDKLAGLMYHNDRRSVNGLPGSCIQGGLCYDLIY